MSLSIAERIVIGSAIEEAVALLPEGFELRLYISKGDVGVALENKAGECFDFIDDWKTVAGMVRDAVQHALVAGEDGQLSPDGRKP